MEKSRRMDVCILGGATMINRESETRAVADLFQGLTDISVAMNPVLKQVYVTKYKKISVKRSFWQWLMRAKVNAYNVTLSLSKEGFITFNLRSLDKDSQGNDCSCA